MLFSHWARGRLHSWTSGTLVWNIFQFFSLLASLPFSWGARAWHSSVVLLASAAELVAPTLFFFPPDKLAQGCLLCLRHFGHVLTAVRPKHGAVAGVCSFLKCHAVLRACVHISFSFFFFGFSGRNLWQCAGKRRLCGERRNKCWAWLCSRGKTTFLHYIFVFQLHWQHLISHRGYLICCFINLADFPLDILAILICLTTTHDTVIQKNRY